jgi:hypothetical protein
MRRRRRRRRTRRRRKEGEGSEIVEEYMGMRRGRMTEKSRI